MTLSRKLLIEDEVVLVTARTHVKHLFWPFVVLLLVSGLVGFGAGVLHTRDNDTLVVAISVVGALVVIGWSVVPFAEWYNRTFTVTDRRLVQQEGIVTKRGRVIPLGRVTDVTFEKQLSDRVFGCGTLVVHDASEQGGLELKDIPRVEEFHRTIAGLLDDRRGHSW